MSERRFVPSVWYHDGWWAVVSVPGYQSGYWRGARFTRLGAAFAARRRAWKLNRLAAGGMEV